MARSFEDSLNSVYIYKCNVQINCYIFNLLRKRRGCRDIYDKIVQVNEIIVPKNWINEIGEISETQ